MSGVVLALLSLLLLATALTLWFWRMNRVALEGRRVGPFTLCGLAVAVGLAALLREPGWIGGGLAITGIVGGVAWIALGLVAKQSRQTPAVVVGQPLPAIEAPDHTGTFFDVAWLRGHPVLIKLFRGHW